MNKIIKYKDYAEVVLYKRDNTEKTRTKIDLSDIKKIKDIRWNHTYYGYVGSNKKGFLHRYIMGVDKGYEIDHINHNTLDNRRQNLRICTRQQNGRNQKIRTDNTSGVKGVYYSKDKRKKRWRALIFINGKEIHLGRYMTKEEATQVREDAEIRYYGEYRFKPKDNQ